MAHALAYLVARPNPHQHDALLNSTGHENFGLFTALALGLLAAGLVRLATGRAWGPQAKAAGEKLFMPALPRLLALQLTGFLLLEAAERVYAGLDPAHVFAEPAVLLGLILQLGAALIGAGLLVLFAKTFQRLFGGRRSALNRSASPVSCPVIRLVPHRFEVATGGGSLRGPPFDF